MAELSKAVPAFKPRGKPVIYSDEELNRVTSAAFLNSRIDSAAQDWFDKAPTRFRTILDTKEVENG